MALFMQTRTWSDLLAEEKKRPYFQKIVEFLEREKAKKAIIYPPQKEIFHAIRLTPFADVKVVIVGQDPYHGPGQAQGLCFSVPPGIPKPPSLENIFKALHHDLQLPIPTQGCLASWARQGVLLLNAVLTVEAHKAASHAHIGWQTFTDKIIALLNEHHRGLVFLLWGASAGHKATMIDTQKHHVLMAPHPSPLSAHRGFLTCKHFSKCNALLAQANKTPIDWKIEE